MADSPFTSASTAATGQHHAALPNDVTSPPPHLQRSNSGTSPASPSAANAHAPKIRRRNRVIASCLECRRRKLKCDKQAPCTNCSKFRRDCLYLAPALDSASQKKLVEIKEKMGTLEQTLERDVARRSSSDTPRSRHASFNQPKVEEESDEDDFPVPEDEKGLEPTPLAALDQVYDDDADDEIMDLGVQLGKMRIAERIGGFVRPKMVEELTATLGDARKKEEYIRNKEASRSRNLLGGSSLPFGYSSGSLFGSSTQPESYLAPGPDYIAPASSFFFPDPRMAQSLTDFLPPRHTADRLVAQYWYAVHPVARCVHRPTFEKQYASFWEHINVAQEPPAPVQALILAALFSAVVSLSDEQCLQHLGTTRTHLMERLRTSTEVSLSRANFLRTTKIDTMQAFVMYLIPLCRAEISRAHSALTGTAIRLAECMGLHRDGSNYGLSPVDTHVRRLIWYQLCFLDIRTCEATGPRPQIHKEDFDTKLPPNVSETDIRADAPMPVDDLPHFTDMTLSKIRFECVELHRQLWIDMPRIDQKKISLTAVLGKIQKFRATMEARYSPMLDERVPIQAYAKRIYVILSSRTFIMVLHRYFYSATQLIPDRLRSILVEAACTSNEGAIAMDTRPDWSPWSWYRGAFFQYHSALLLLIYVYTFPEAREAARVWKSMDFIFDLPGAMDPKMKAEAVIMEVRDRMEVYQSLRKMRATTQLRSKMGEWGVPPGEHEVQLQQQQQQQQQGQQGLQNQQVHERMGEVRQAVGGRMGAVGEMHPAQFSPPPLMSSTDSSNSPEAYQATVSGSSSAGPTPQQRQQMDTQMQTLAEIDWNEWDKFFPEQGLEQGMDTTSALNPELANVADVDLNAFNNPFDNFSQPPGFYFVGR